jgi:hypothetical protein
MLVLLNGKVVGLDIVSRESAYKVLHAKLVKSYAMEAILQRKKIRQNQRMTRQKHLLKKHHLVAKKSMNQ